MDFQTHLLLNKLKSLRSRKRKRKRKKKRKRKRKKRRKRRRKRRRGEKSNLSSPSLGSLWILNGSKISLGKLGRVTGGGGRRREGLGGGAGQDRKGIGKLDRLDRLIVRVAVLGHVGLRVGSIVAGHIAGQGHLAEDDVMYDADPIGTIGLGGGGDDVLAVRGGDAEAEGAGDVFGEGLDRGC